MSAPERCKYGYRQPCELGWPGCICSDESVTAAIEAGSAKRQGGPMPERPDLAAIRAALELSMRYGFPGGGGCKCTACSVIRHVPSLLAYVEHLEQKEKP